MIRALIAVRLSGRSAHDEGGDVSESFVPSNKGRGEGREVEAFRLFHGDSRLCKLRRGSTRKNQSFRKRSASMPFFKKGHLILSGK